ncbi:MAG: hypothetical protein ABFD91_17795 [Anaerohalosphaeraceae bacterium]
MKDLIETIFSAFKDYSRPDRDNIALHAGDLKFEALEDFAGMENSRISVDFLVPKHRQSLFFMTKNAFYYYLLAYMKVAVQNYDRADTIPGMLINLFTLPVARDWDRFDSILREQTLIEEYTPLIASGSTVEDMKYFRERFHLLDISQKHAILLFIEAIREVHGHDFPDHAPQIAINNYWHHF